MILADRLFCNTSEHANLSSKTHRMVQSHARRSVHGMFYFAAKACNEPVRLGTAGADQGMAGAR